MARPKSTKPWLHKPSGYWCATIQSKRHYLDRDYQIACRKLKSLRNQEQRAEAGGKDWLDAPFANLAGLYLSDVQKCRSVNTYKANRYRILRVLKILGTTLKLGKFKKLHLTQIVQHMTADYSPTTIADTITATQAIFNFAVKNDLLEFNPLKGFEKPARRGRTRIITPHEKQLLLKNADPFYRRLLVSAFFTGCRPIELRTLIWGLGRPRARLLDISKSQNDHHATSANATYRPTATEHLEAMQVGSPKLGHRRTSMYSSTNLATHTQKIAWSEKWLEFVSEPASK